MIFCNRYTLDANGACPAGDLPRHPSQLYEAALEGVVLFLVLRVLTHRYHKLATRGFVSGAFCAGYGAARTFAEFFREPDIQIGYLAGGLTMGMLLSVPMILFGIGLMIWASRRDARAVGGSERRRRMSDSAAMTPLAEKIARHIREAGPITIADFMALCLADREFGYYIRRDPLGQQGDFITAPEVSQIFGELIGIWAVAVWEMMGMPTPFILAELGPGRGTLMADLLRAAKIKPTFRTAADIHLVEISPHLQAIQEKTLAASGLAVAWHERIEDIPAGTGDHHRQRILRRAARAPVRVARRQMERAHRRHRRGRQAGVRGAAGGTEHSGAAAPRRRGGGDPRPRALRP